MKSFKPKPNYIWSILSVSGVLLLLAIFVFITLHSNDLVQSFKEDFEMVVELSPTTNESMRDELLKFISEDPQILAGSIQYVSKEEGLALLADQLGAEVFISDMPNPLFDVVTFHVKASEFDAASLEALRTRYIAEFDEVLDVYYESSLVQQVTSNLDRLSVFFLVAGLLLIFFAVTLIHNSIRLAIYANRFLIRNMELVGASWSFIRRPFLTKSLRHGLLSSVLALFLLTGLAFLLWNQVPEIASYVKIEFLGIIALLIFGLGLLINLSSTWFVVTRFLKMRLSELHA